MSSSLDEIAVNNQRERYMELAGMYKERKKGRVQSLQRILAKFALQEGISSFKAAKYLDLLKSAELIIVSKGGKVWSYNEEAEWELFKVNI
jgi:hypothetical protein